MGDIFALSPKAGLRLVSVSATVNLEYWDNMAQPWIAWMKLWKTGGKLFNN
ncbi:MAG: hypothetical protein ACJAX6_000368 [Limisphaerales bacterium]|jgi:hypothetical protein